jgi:hypothetical protein
LKKRQRVSIIFWLISDFNIRGVMKIHILIFILFGFIWPAAGQSKNELLKENARLKNEIEQLKSELSESNKREVEFHTRIKAAEYILRTTNTDSFAFEPTIKNTTKPLTDYTKSNNLNNESAKATQEQERGQCKAITKAGTRCSRKAAEGSDFCWQHASSTSTPEYNNTPTHSTSYSTSSRTIYTGPRGGKYYIGLANKFRTNS